MTYSIRVCTNPQSLEEHRSHILYLTKEKTFLEDTLSARQEEFHQVVRYEAEREGLQMIARDTSLAAVLLGHDCFVEFKLELKKLEEFLIAQAEAEFKYAERLEAQHKLFAPTIPGLSAENESEQPRKRATTTELMSKTREYLHIKDDSTPQPSLEPENNVLTANVKKASFQFFTGYSEFNSSSANKYHDFGNFILDSVLGDVKGLIMEVEEGKIDITTAVKLNHQHDCDLYCSCTMLDTI